MLYCDTTRQHKAGGPDRRLLGLNSYLYRYLRCCSASTQPGEAVLDHRPEQRDQAEDHDAAHQRVREEDPERSLRPQQRLTEGFLSLVAEHDGEHQRGE